MCKRTCTFYSVWVLVDVVGIVISWTGAERAYIYMCETVRAVSASTTRSGFAWVRLWLAYACVMRVCPLRRAGGDNLTPEGQLASQSPRQVAPSSHADTPCGRASQSLLSAHSNNHRKSISERLSLWGLISGAALEPEYGSVILLIETEWVMCWWWQVFWRLQMHFNDQKMI